MILHPPYPEVPGDNTERRLAASSGDVVGFSRARAVWRFGAMKDSPLAVGLGACSEAFLFVLATHRGRILATHYGFALARWVDGEKTLAEPLSSVRRFQRVLDAKL